jgi:hypothetical protein
MPPLGDAAVQLLRADPERLAEQEAEVLRSA